MAIWKVYALLTPRRSNLLNTSRARGRIGRRRKRWSSDLQSFSVTEGEVHVL